MNSLDTDIEKAKQSLARAQEYLAALERQRDFQEFLGEPENLFMVYRDADGYIYQVAGVFRTKAMAEAFIMVQPSPEKYSVMPIHYYNKVEDND